jgi:hypothetical protein
MGVIRMRNIALALFLGALLTGCLSGDEIFLSPEEADALVENFEETVAIQQEMAEFSFEAVRGDLDLSQYGSYTYDPPTQANGWVGTLDFPRGSFPWGDGDFSVVFTASGDGGPVDPLLEDLSDDVQVDIDAVVNFLGTTSVGKDIDSSADFTMSTVQNGVNDVVTRLDGTFDIIHDGYRTALDATDVEMDIDIALEEITSITGSLAGEVDIPNFHWDAAFDIDGLGDTLQIGIDVVATTITYTLGLDELF